MIVSSLSKPPSTNWLSVHTSPLLLLASNVGAAASDPKLKEDIELARISALDSLTSLIINAPVCREAVPTNRSMLFRIASAIASSESVPLLSAAAQVLAQALSEDDLVQPSELASLHTYDLVEHLTQV
jgi:hypothetical protein